MANHMKGALMKSPPYERTTHNDVDFKKLGRTCISNNYVEFTIFPRFWFLIDFTTKFVFR